MKKLACLAAMVCLVCAAVARAQEPARRMSNQDVIELVKAGLSDDVVIAKIRAVAAGGEGTSAFDTSVDGLKSLKEANVSDAVIKVMINPAPPPAPVVAAVQPMTMDPNLPPPEVGVYWKDGANFVLIQGRTLDQTKAGGRAGSYFTDGMRNQHWDAVIDGPHSGNLVKERRPTFYLYVPDGSDALDYVLLVLNKKGDRREFQVGSFGGVTGGKSGIKKDKVIEFTPTHMGIRIYKVALMQDLKPGEYAFFMGTGAQSTMAGARGGNRSGGAAGGRVYDFSIPE